MTRTTQALENHEHIPPPRMKLDIATLAIAQIRVKGQNEGTTPVHCLCDSGAQNNLMTRNCADRIGPRIYPTDRIILGLGGREDTYGVAYGQISTAEGKDLRVQASFAIIEKLSTTQTNLKQINNQGRASRRRLRFPWTHRSHSRGWHMGPNNTKLNYPPK